MQSREDRVASGNMAEIALRFFEGDIRKVQERNLALLAGEFRNGNFTEAKAIAFVSSHCALDDVLAELKRKVTSANKLQKEILNGSPHDS